MGLKGDSSRSPLDAHLRSEGSGIVREGETSEESQLNGCERGVDAIPLSPQSQEDAPLASPDAPPFRHDRTPSKSSGVPLSSVENASAFPRAIFQSRGDPLEPMEHRPTGPTYTQVLVRDFAFASSDPRHTSTSQPTSSAARWGSAWDGDRNENLGETARKELDGHVEWGWSIMGGSRGGMHRSEMGEAGCDELGSEEELPVAEGSLYVAAFAFQAEGESEMDLAPDDVVRVFSPACNGWVVANKVRFDTNGDVVEDDADDHCGLCPFSYLRRWNEERHVSSQ